ncbi:glycerophosphoryl diester phosphodiesterase [Geodermatophilus saharensis]|uniref:Glycerophosphoryl diester phosphodiesterase n=1 Tax=Geodermatophilus saharensis TaxID=1137994 RepID=A0A239D364_9ACTN|nr:glycerophosphodiester phosphodiesterase [Geodermatophilus saharensis]SNS26274.1 glycerophosphoryl diester phosphodiesterase [Geodermatophilus saharensis]
MDFADLRRPFVIAHRGGALQVPEHTLEGYRVAVGQGLPVIEQDVLVLADGGLGVMHDGTVDRMTTSSGNVADHTSVSWKQLDIDASATLGGGWPDGLRPPLFDEVLTEFGNRVLLCAEAKGTDAMAPMLAALERRGVRRGAVLLQSFSLADCRLARSRGWEVVWLGSTDVARAAAEGIGWLGPEAGQVTAALCTRAHAAGIEVACHTVNRRYRRDALVADGVDAVFSDDPVYLAGDAARRTTDLFARQVWLPGMQADTDRGRFFPDDRSWGFAASDDATSALLGFLAPPEPAAFTLRLRVRLDEARGDPHACGASVLLSADDRPFLPPPGVSPGVEGLLVLLRADGTIGVSCVSDGVAVPVASSTEGAPLPAGRYVPLQVTVTGPDLTVRAGTATVTVTDGGVRPVPVVHLGSVSAGVRFTDLELT